VGVCVLGGGYPSWVLYGVWGWVCLYLWLGYLSLGVWLCSLFDMGVCGGWVSSRASPGPAKGNPRFPS
jgi:hypothetical protein